MAMRDIERCILDLNLRYYGACRRLRVLPISGAMRSSGVYFPVHTYKLTLLYLSLG